MIDHLFLCRWRVNRILSENKAKQYTSCLWKVRDAKSSLSDVFPFLLKLLPVVLLGDYSVSDFPLNNMLNCKIWCLRSNSQNKKDNNLKESKFSWWWKQSFLYLSSFMGIVSACYCSLRSFSKSCFVFCIISLVSLCLQFTTCWNDWRCVTGAKSIPEQNNLRSDSAASLLRWVDAVERSLTKTCRRENNAHAVDEKSYSIA